MVLRATGDHVIPNDATRYMLHTQPRAQLIEIDGPHLLMQTRPDECRAAVTRFMQTLV
jgi:pimeloyl-ACP methyl ester carboxylesterase